VNDLMMSQINQVQSKTSDRSRRVSSIVERIHIVLICKIPVCYPFASIATSAEPYLLVNSDGTSSFKPSELSY
jgi:hypothetical protein